MGVSRVRLPGVIFMVETGPLAELDIERNLFRAWLLKEFPFRSRNGELRTSQPDDGLLDQRGISVKFDNEFQNSRAIGRYNPGRNPGLHPISFHREYLVKDHEDRLS